jgi:hypothetical protein
MDESRGAFDQVDVLGRGVARCRYDLRWAAAIACCLEPFHFREEAEDGADADTRELGDLLRRWLRVALPDQLE